MKRFASPGLVTLGLVATLSLSIAALVSAQSGRGGGPPDIQERLERMSDQLDLTQDQEREIEQIFEDGESQSSPMKRQLAQIRNEIQGEMLKDDPNKNTVIQLTREAGDLRTEMSLLRVENQFAIHAVLTPEQREKLASMKAERGKRGGGRGHRGGGR